MLLFVEGNYNTSQNYYYNYRMQGHSNCHGMVVGFNKNECKIETSS